MTRVLLTLAIISAGLSLGSAALACSPLTRIDPVTREPINDSPEQRMAWEQGEWRQRSEIVLLTQVRSGRMVSNGEIEFTLVPYESVYGGDVPTHDLLFSWHPGHTCNRFPVMITDELVVYVDSTGAIISAIRPEDLQDRPPEFGRRLREIARGLLLPRDAP